LEGFGFIRRAKGMLPLLTVATALNFLLVPLSTLLPYYIKVNHSGEAPDLALVMAFFQGGILVGRLVMSVIKGFKKKMAAVAISLYVIFLGYALVALTPSQAFWFMSMSGTIMALCVPVANVTLQTIIQTVVPAEMQGRVNSVVMALASAATPVGMILSGAIVGFIRTANLFLTCAIVGALIVTLSWLFTDVKHVENVELSALDS